MAYLNLSDEELVARCARGEREALAALYDRYATLVFSLVSRMLGGGMTAEEVTQDSFVLLWRRADQFSPERGRVLSWLMTIARNRAIDELRRRQAAPEQVELVDAAAGYPGMEELSLQRMQMRRALAQLPEAQREALELAYYGGMTQQEVAEHLGLPLGTIKTRMRMGLQRLRDVLQENESVSRRS
ncbi:MAG: sigma-70 family RNA polymerase sigma factor [Anaerolineae bacterium]